MSIESRDPTRRGFIRNLAALGFVAATVPSHAESIDHKEEIAQLSEQGRDIIRDAKKDLLLWFPTDAVTENYEEPVRPVGVTRTESISVDRFPNFEELSATANAIGQLATAFNTIREQFFDLLRTGTVPEARSALDALRQSELVLREATQKAERDVPNVREFMAVMNGWQIA